MSDERQLPEEDGEMAGFTETAIIRVAESYRRQLCNLVEREMGKRFQSKVDSEDVVQSMYGSFFRGKRERDWTIDDEIDLWRLLATITRHKMLKRIEQITAAKRSPDKEVSAETNLLASREPSPDDAAVASDLIEKALDGLGPPYPEVVAMRLSGLTRKEIAEKLERTEAVVRSMLQRIRDRLAEYFEKAE